MQRHSFTKSIIGKTIVVESPNGTEEKIAWLVAVPPLCPNHMEAFISEFKTHKNSRKTLIAEWRSLKSEKTKGGLPVCNIFEILDRAKVRADRSRHYLQGAFKTKNRSSSTMVDLQL